MKNVIVRSLSGIVYIAVIVTALYMQGWAIAALCTVFAAIAAYEYVNINDKSTDNQASTLIKDIDILLISLPVAFAVFSLAYFARNIDYYEASYTSFYEIIWLLLPLPILFRLIISVFDKSKSEISSLNSTITGIFYIAIPLISVCFIDFLDVNIALMMFVLIWVNDTGAFCVGCTMGRHKLCERLSPKKTIEGFLGGMVFCVIAAVIFALIFKYRILPFVVYGLIVSIMATIGDLFESMLKRRAGVKDAGNLIPGHGGILDRIDSLLFVAPMTLIFIFTLLLA